MNTQYIEMMAAAATLAVLDRMTVARRFVVDYITETGFGRVPEMKVRLGESDTAGIFTERDVKENNFLRGLCKRMASEGVLVESRVGSRVWYTIADAKVVAPPTKAVAPKKTTAPKKAVPKKTTKAPEQWPHGTFVDTFGAPKLEDIGGELKTIGEARDLVEATLSRLGYADRQVRVEFNNRFTSRMGDATYNLNRIRLSSKLFSVATVVERRQTIVHEVCHLTSFWRNGRKGTGHGKSWQGEMMSIGFSADRCHQVHYRADKVEVTCGCTSHWVTKNKATKIAQGASYSCRKCGRQVVVKGTEAVSAQDEARNCKWQNELIKAEIDGVFVRDTVSFKTMWDARKGRTLLTVAGWQTSCIGNGLVVRVVA